MIAQAGKDFDIILVSGDPMLIILYLQSALSPGFWMLRAIKSASSPGLIGPRLKILSAWEGRVFFSV